MVELTPGLELGARFVLMRRLGRGGSAEVWLADDRERGETVALKILDPADEKGTHPFEKGSHPISASSSENDAAKMGMGCDPFSKGFVPSLQAAQLAAEVARGRSIPAEFTVPVLSVHEIEGRTLLAMEYMPGGDLGQFRGRSFESWGSHVDDVAAAIEAVHAAGLVHRDLKCSNVLLDQTGRARLSDFGIAAVTGSRAPPGGSPYNASPQQLRGEAALPSDDLYALGALLYELIAGHPPYYPEITRDRVLHEPVPPLVPRGVVPAGVRELALRLLAKSPRERPATAADVRIRLAAAACGEGGIMEPIALAMPDVTASAVRRSRLLPAALAAVAVLVIAAVVWLPQRFATGKSGITEEARAQAELQNRERLERAQTETERAAARAEAEALRTKFETAFKALDARAAARWATADFAAARDAGAVAADRYAAEKFSEAAAGWKRGGERLAALDKRLPTALKETLQRGQAALAAGKTAAAREAFQLALAIDEANAPARSGMARADKLDQALAIVDTAIADESAGRPAAAEQGFRRALAIDPGVTAAQEGLARIAARRSGEAYAAAMSRGFADLAQGRNESARRSFESALALRPGSVEARDAIAALEQGQKAASLELLAARAASAEREERWDEALTAWREAAALESSLESARAGIARTTPRAELQRRIDALNREPQRLWDPAGRAEARNLLATAAAAGNPRQRLAAAARELERLAAAAQTPVKLRMRSDGVTQVAIYRIGQYGTFSERDVELLPGRYTVVGTRNGFRDVRQEVILPPGAPASAIVVRCEEPI
jgi:eukaryotic-like serine/threonine-protein kinase